jgi:hypothetical protein
MEVQVGPAERLPQLGQVYAAVLRASASERFSWLPAALFGRHRPLSDAPKFVGLGF